MSYLRWQHALVVLALSAAVLASNVTYSDVPEILDNGIPFNSAVLLPYASDAGSTTQIFLVERFVGNVTQDYPGVFELSGIGIWLNALPSSVTVNMHIYQSYPRAYGGATGPRLGQPAPGGRPVASILNFLPNRPMPNVTLNTTVFSNQLSLSPPLDTYWLAFEFVDLPPNADTISSLAFQPITADVAAPSTRDGLLARRSVPAATADPTDLGEFFSNTTSVWENSQKVSLCWFFIGLVSKPDPTPSPTPSVKPSVAPPEEKLTFWPKMNGYYKPSSASVPNQQLLGLLVLLMSVVAALVL